MVCIAGKTVVTDARHLFNAVANLKVCQSQSKLKFDGKHTMQSKGFDILKMSSPSLTSPSKARPRPVLGMEDVMISRGTRELTLKGNALPGASDPFVDGISVCTQECVVVMFEVFDGC